MQIGIIGYGKMGIEIATIAENRGHQIYGKIDVHNRSSLKDWKSGQIDAAVEFTTPEHAFENIKQCIDLGIPVVSGTTGWLHQKQELDLYCQENEGTYFYASNYSLGVNLTFRFNSFLAKVMNQYPEFQVSMEEIHHTEKKDAPSGTAITLAEGVINGLDRISQWTLDNPTQSGNLPVTALREGKVPGTHTVKYTSENDEITLRHKALNRKGFALGAVLVTEWIQNRKGILSMEEFLDL